MYVLQVLQFYNKQEMTLLKNIKHGISQLPASAHRTRLPCTLDMINFIVNQNTTPSAFVAVLLVCR